MILHIHIVKSDLQWCSLFESRFVDHIRVTVKRIEPVGCEFSGWW